MPILQFKGKTAVEPYHHTVPHHTLEFDSKLSALPKGRSPSLDDNLIIEGDNLLALKALLPTHAGRIKCIYIDPPYNTGNEGWIYNDKLNQPQFKEWIGQVVGKEEDDACRHDKWCCMMYPRLQLLKELLSDDGAIFVSIDDNEVHHLHALMNEVFGGENFCAQFEIVNNLKGRNDKANVATCHEHLVMYSRKAGLKAAGVPLSPEQIARFKYVDENGKRYDLRDLRRRGLGDRREDRPNMWFPIYCNKAEGTFSLERKSNDDIKITPKRGDGTDGRWRWGKKRVAQNLHLFEASYTKRSEKWDIAYRVYLDQASSSALPGEEDLDEDEEIEPSQRSTPKSVFWGPEFSTDLAKRTVKELLALREDVPHPKPVALLRRILHIAADKDSIILDSFAGSGTTAHSVLVLNREHGGNRKFILIQLPFDTKEDETKKLNICEKITAERVRRVIKGYSRKTQGHRTERVAGLGGSFSYARLSDKPLFGEFRDFGSNPPPYEEIARYVFYTETSQQWNPAKLQKKTGKIGEHAGTSYYLLYSPNQKADVALDAEFLKTTATQDANKKLVVYCEKIWLHRSTLREWEAANGKTVRTMIVPFNLR